VIRIAPHGAIERELPRAIRHEVDGDRLARLDGTGIDTQAPNREAVNDVLRPDTEAHTLPLVHDDAFARPPAGGGLARH
jgi:hypothetical protein